MTYKELLDSLLEECERTGAAYVCAMGSRSQPTNHIYSIRKEWEHAEDDLELCLDLLRSKKFSLNDIVTDVLAEIVLPAGVHFQA